MNLFFEKTNPRENPQSLDCGCCPRIFPGIPKPGQTPHFSVEYKTEGFVILKKYFLTKIIIAARKILRKARRKIDHFKPKIGIKINPAVNAPIIPPKVFIIYAKPADRPRSFLLFRKRELKSGKIIPKQKLGKKIKPNTKNKIVVIGVRVPASASLEKKL